MTHLPRVKVKPLDWEPYVAPVEVAQASAEQLEAMKVTPSATKVSPYVRTLAHDPESYVARTTLFNAIMYAEGGLPRPDRELGALGASLVNGCPYCAMVHARRLTQLNGNDDAVSALWFGLPERLSGREQAVWTYAQALSRTPSEAGPEHVARLRAEGLSDAEILDLTHAVGIFCGANRLMHVLGHPVAQG